MQTRKIKDLEVPVIVMRPVGHGALINRLALEPDLAPLKEFGVQTWGQALMAWLIADPRVTVLIPATTRPQRVLENAAVGDVSLAPGDARLRPQRSPPLP